MKRMISVSTTPRKKPATRPSPIPAESESVTTIRPMISEKRAPWMMRERMSRPTASVPSRNSALPPAIQNGGARKCSRNCSAGACGATWWAKTAASTTITITTSPPTAPLFSLK